MPQANPNTTELGGGDASEQPQGRKPSAERRENLPAEAPPRLHARSQDAEFTIEYYEGGRYRLCLDTSNPDKLPRFRQAIDCIEKILKLQKGRCRADDFDGDWAE